MRNIQSVGSMGIDRKHNIHRFLPVTASRPLKQVQVKTDLELFEKMIKELKKDQIKLSDMMEAWFMEYLSYKGGHDKWLKDWAKARGRLINFQDDDENN